MYIANHYVRINGQMYVRGEILPDDLPKEKIEWLEEAGAIHEEAPVSAVAEEPMDPSDGFPEADESESEAEPEEEEEEPEEIEAPEVDVMAGIVQEEEPPAEKPAARKGGRRKAK